MLRKLLAGLFWIILANLLVKPFWILGVEVGVQNAVGNEVYGFYISIFNLTYIFNILLDLGLTNYNTRNIAQHPHLIGKHLSGILGIKLCLMVLYAVVTFTVGLLMGYGSREFHLLALLTLCQALNSLILYLRSNFEGLLLFRWDSLFSVLDRVLMIVICGMLLWGPFRMQQTFRIEHFAYAQLAAYLLTATLALGVIARKTHLRRINFDLRFFLIILRQSAPFALLVLLMASYNRIDPILLRHFASDAQAGIYAGAFRLLDALTMVAYLVSVPLLPIFARLCKTQSQTQHNSELVGILRMVFWPMILFAIGCALVGCVWAEPLMTWLYHKQGIGIAYVPVFRLLIFCLIPIGLTYIFGTLLTAGGKMRQLNLFAIASLVLNVVVNLLLIPHWGAVGSAIAALSAQSLMAITQTALSIHLFHLPLATFLPPTPHQMREAIALLLHR